MLFNALLKSMSSAQFSYRQEFFVAESDSLASVDKCIQLCMAWHMPHQAGASYVTLAAAVAQNMSRSAVTGMSWLRRTRKAHNRLEQDDTRLFTCSVAVRRSLTTMPSIL